MTALFALMLVLFIISYINFNNTLRASEEQKKKIIEIQNTVTELMKDNNDFEFDSTYKRYRLKQDIQFEINRYVIEPGSIADYETTVANLKRVGSGLGNLVNNLKKKKESDTAFREISYLFVVSGRSSDLPGNDRTHNYELSYKRAFYLQEFWKESLDLNLDDPAYHNLIDFQIAGNGIGGVGRVPKETDDNGFLDLEAEKRNQSIFIQIVPKVGKFESLMTSK